MSQYAVVENGIITEKYDSIPTSWRNISGFNLMTDDERANLGFLPVQQSSITFDPVRQKLISNDVELDSSQKPYVNRVVEDTMSDSEYNTFLFNQSLSLLRNKRDALMLASDWAVLPDLATTKGQPWIDAWNVYRQKLRDITNNYKSNNTNFDPQSVVFPDKPFNSQP